MLLCHNNHQVCGTVKETKSMLSEHLSSLFLQSTGLFKTTRCKQIGGNVMITPMQELDAEVAIG